MLLMGSFVFLAVLFAGLALRELPRRSERQIQLVFGETGPPGATPGRAPEAAAGSGRAGAGLVEGEPTGGGLTAVQLLGLSAVVSLFGAAAAYTVLPRWYAPMLGALAGLWAPRWWVARVRHARAEAFGNTLDAALGKMASYLRAGRSLDQAIQLMAEETDGPARTEFQRAGRAISLGATPAEALARVAQRVQSRDFELVVVAVSILTRTGGNLAEVLQKIAQQIQERRLARKAVLATTAQIRITAYTITAMPFAMTLLLRALNPDYFEPLLASGSGQAVLAGCYGAVGLAWVWIRTMMRMEVD